MELEQNQESEQFEPNKLKKGFEKVIKLTTKIKSNNKIVRTYTKISNPVNVLKDYKSNLNQTNSHTESAIITGTEFVATKSTQTMGFVLASEIGLKIAASGGFTLPACLAGSIVGGTTFYLGLEASEQIKSITNNVTTHTIKYARQMLPGYIQPIIRECIGEPVEQFLKSAYTLGSESISKIINTISQTLYENWDKLKPEQTIVYCEDLNKKKISIELNKQVATRVFNYCQSGLKNHDEMKCLGRYGTEYSGTSKSAFQFNEFNSKINDFQTQLNSYDFVSKTTNPTPYELVLMDFSKSRPNPNLITRNKINSNSIPNYQVSVHVSGGGGGDSGILAGVGGAVIIAIKVSFLF